MEALDRKLNTDAPAVKESFGIRRYDFRHGIGLT